MERKQLANGITDFCIKYKIFNITKGTKEIKKSIAEQLEDAIFVEGLINMMIVKSKNNESIDTDMLIELLSELERLRLELEFTPERVSEKC